jgi:hypothetical protein
MEKCENCQRDGDRLIPKIYKKSTLISPISLFFGAGQQVVKTLYVTIVDMDEVFPYGIDLIRICAEKFHHIAFVACAAGGEF